MSDTEYQAECYRRLKERLAEMNTYDGNRSINKPLCDLIKKIEEEVKG